MASDSSIVPRTSDPVALGSISLPRRQLSYRYVINDAKIFLEKKGSEGLRSPNFSIVLPKNSVFDNIDSQQQTTVWHLQVRYSEFRLSCDREEGQSVLSRSAASSRSRDRINRMVVQQDSVHIVQSERFSGSVDISLYQGSREAVLTSTIPAAGPNRPRVRSLHQPVPVQVSIAEESSRILITDCNFRIINSETGEAMFTKASQSPSSLERKICNESPGSCGSISFDCANINKYLSHGTLTIQVDATILCYTDPIELVHQEQRKPLEDNVLAGIKCLFEDKLLSDVTIKCGDAEFKAHKAILASQSPVFKKMLESDMKEQRTNVIEISDVDQAVISDMLAYLYTGSAPHLDTLVKELLNVANKYELSQLFTMCEDNLKAEIAVANVIGLLILADMHSASYLKKACLNYIRHNSATVRSSSQWEELRKNSERHSSLLVEIMDYTLQ